MTTASCTRKVPGYVEGRWTIDPLRSVVSFAVRHLIVSTVRGHFGRLDGQIVLAEHPLDSSVEAVIGVAPINSHDADRDAYIRSAAVLDVQRYPIASYRSMALRSAGSYFRVEGELTLHGTTLDVAIVLEVNGFMTDPYGGTRARFSGTAQINLRDFGITFNTPPEDGGVVIDDRVHIGLEIEAIREPTDLHGKD